MRGSGDLSGYGQWLLNAIVAATTALFVALVVVGVSVLIDRMDSPGIEITSQGTPDQVIHIAGAVATPGVYVLPHNGRLVDALDAAGGLTEDADRTQLNLAARVGDGERIVIPVMIPFSGSASDADQTGSVLINVNTATVEELDTLPGVGPVIAGRIVDERESNGPFLTVDSLTRVTGISTGTLEELRPMVTVSD